MTYFVVFCIFLTQSNPQTSSFYFTSPRQTTMSLMALFMIQNINCMDTRFYLSPAECILLEKDLSSLSLPETIHCHSFSIGICESAFLNLYYFTLRHLISCDLFPKIPSQYWITAGQNQQTVKHYLCIDQMKEKKL